MKTCRFREAKWLAQRHTAELGFKFFVYMNIAYLLAWNLASPRFAILPVWFMVVAPASRTILAHSRYSIYIYSIYTYFY